MAQTVITVKRLDFDGMKHATWKDKDGTEFPLVGCIGIYRYCGILEAAEKYRDEHPGFEICPLDNLFCNFNTLQKFKEQLEYPFRRYKLDIDGDGHIIWLDPDNKEPYNYDRDMTAAAEGSVGFDFVNYCPSIDDEVEDDIIEFRITTPDPEEDKENEETDDQNS